MRSILKLAAAVAVLLVAGCAGDYWSYSHGCVPYAYCVPPPLSHTDYADCGCPTPIASQYEAARAIEDDAVEPSE